MVATKRRFEPNLQRVRVAGSTASPAAPTSARAASRAGKVSDRLVLSLAAFAGCPRNPSRGRLDPKGAKSPGPYTDPVKDQTKGRRNRRGQRRLPRGAGGRPRSQPAIFRGRCSRQRDARSAVAAVRSSTGRTYIVSFDYLPARRRRSRAAPLRWLRAACPTSAVDPRASRRPPTGPQLDALLDAGAVAYLTKATPRARRGSSRPSARPPAGVIAGTSLRRPRRCGPLPAPRFRPVSPGPHLPCSPTPRRTVETPRESGPSGVRGSARSGLLTVRDLLVLPSPPLGAAGSSPPTCAGRALGPGGDGRRPRSFGIRGTRSGSAAGSHAIVEALGEGRGAGFAQGPLVQSGVGSTDRLQPGARVTVARPELAPRKLLSHPTRPDGDPAIISAGPVPVYRASEAISSKRLRELVARVLPLVGHLTHPLPAVLRCGRSPCR